MIAQRNQIVTRKHLKQKSYRDKDVVKASLSHKNSHLTISFTHTPILDIQYDSESAALLPFSQVQCLVALISFITSYISSRPVFPFLALVIHHP